MKKKVFIFIYIKEEKKYNEVLFFRRIEMSEIMISELEEIKSIFDKTGDVKSTVLMVVELFKKNGIFRYDVVNYMFNYKEEFQIEFCKVQYKDYFKKMEEKSKSENEDYLKLSGILFFTLLSVNKVTSKTIVEMAKSQTSKEYFKNLEIVMFSEQRNLMKSMLKPVSYMTNKESIETLRNFYKTEYEGIYYEKEIMNIYEELCKDK